MKTIDPAARYSYLQLTARYHPPQAAQVVSRPQGGTRSLDDRARCYLRAAIDLARQARTSLRHRPWLVRGDAQGLAVGRTMPLASYDRIEGGLHIGPTCRRCPADSPDISA